MASQFSVYVVFVFAIAIAAIRCNEEVTILSTWKAALKDPDDNLRSWDPSLETPCDWFHVTCENERVTRLDLGNMRLFGHLVPELGKLTNLKYLEVYSSNISGSIPAEIGNLTNLIALDLDHNQLTGPLPASLSNLKLLRYMRLNFNKLSGTVPESVRNFLQDKLGTGTFDLAGNYDLHWR